MSYFRSRIIQIFIASLVSNHAMAQEIIVDLGLFPSTPCIKSNLPRPSNQTSLYGERMVKVSAKLFIEPTNPRTIAAAQSCAHQIRDQLAESRSAVNLQLFSEIFQEAVSKCVMARERGVRFVKSLVMGRDTCQ